MIRLARAALCACALIVIGTSPAGAARDRTAAAKELDAIEDRIRSLEKDVARAAAGKPTAAKALERAERSEADARRALAEVRAELEAGRKREQALRAELTRAQAELAAHRERLSSQLRLAYVAGREEWLRLALTQEDPAALSRRVVYYGYITRERTALLRQVEAQISGLEATAAALRTELERLAGLGRRQEAHLREVAAARRARARAVQTLERELATGRQKLARLRAEARALEDLMARLARESRPDPPPERESAAAHLRDLPLGGRLIARYGQPRAEGLLRWDGLLIAAPAGTDVRAVRAGRVAYAGWLPGMGQLVVVDHGGGLMSLYGHNQDVLKKTGERVGRGEVIARVGDSGGQGKPGLYFEVRRNGKPVDPGPWVR
jgi:septal ring factor EnvC (AmiA/AmiB activator)